MSVEPPTDPTTPTLPTSQPPNPAPAIAPAIAPATPASGAGERRGLLLALAAIEFVLMLIPLLLPTVAAPVPVEGSGGPPCVFGSGGPGGPTVVDNCQTVLGPDQSLALIALVCALLSVLVLPVLIGALSRRWQTALALPSAPFWVLTALLALLTTSARASDVNNSGFSDPFQAYSQIFSLLFSTPMILMILIAGGLGALAWLVRRGLTR